MRRTMFTLIAVLGLTAALALSACSDDDGGSDSEDTTEVTETTETSEPESVPDAPEAAITIADLVSVDERFTTLNDLVTSLGLTATLSDEGPYTVFAPSDDAFDTLPPGFIDGISGGDETRTDIVTYHVVEGEVFAADLTDGMEVEMLNGESLTVGVDGDEVTLTDGSGETVSVVTPDIEADNGVIHVIDGVLIPAP